MEVNVWVKENPTFMKIKTVAIECEKYGMGNWKFADLGDGLKSTDSTLAMTKFVNRWLSRVLSKVNVLDGCNLVKSIRLKIHETTEMRNSWSWICVEIDEHHSELGWHRTSRRCHSNRIGVRYSSPRENGSEPTKPTKIEFPNLNLSASFSDYASKIALERWKPEFETFSLCLSIRKRIWKSSFQEKYISKVWTQKGFLEFSKPQRIHSSSYPSSTFPHKSSSVKQITIK
jgi:hypothetical protein